MKTNALRQKDILTKYLEPLGFKIVDFVVKGTTLRFWIEEQRTKIIIKMAYDEELTIHACKLIAELTLEEWRNVVWKEEGLIE